MCPFEVMVEDFCLVVRGRQMLGYLRNHSRLQTWQLMVLTLETEK